MQKKIWLDCDTGTDDALAIILAGHHENIDLLGISTIFGNDHVENTTLNTLRILELSELKNIKVFKGSERPLLRDKIKYDKNKFHGEHGLGRGINLPYP